MAYPKSILEVVHVTLMQFSLDILRAQWSISPHFAREFPLITPWTENAHVTLAFSKVVAVRMDISDGGRRFPLISV